MSKAVKANEELTTLDDSYRANVASYSQAQKDAKNQEMNDIADVRRGLFGEAIQPLEAAKRLLTDEGSEVTEVCLALYQAYVQTNDLEKAADVQDCAGLSDTSGDD